MIHLEQLIYALEQADFLKEQLSAAQALHSRLRENELTIAVIGQFKRGKSSVINAMLNTELLPVGIIPLTSVATEIRYAPQPKAVVCFTDGRSEEIQMDHIGDYCSETQNSENYKGVQKVQLWTPCHPFGEGIVLVDTPGVGSIHQHNTESSLQYIRQSDAVLFLLSVDSPVSETERDFLLSTKEFAPRFFFAVNKIDTVSQSDLDVFTTFCRKVLSESTGSNPELLPVSAKTAQGIPELVHVLTEELHASGQRILADSAERKAEIIIQQAQAKIELALQAASLPRDELAEKLGNIAARQKELVTFSEDLRVLGLHRTELLIDRIGDSFKEKAGQIAQEAAALGNTFYAQNSTLPFAEFDRQLQDALNAFLKGKLEDLNDSGLRALEAGYTEISDVLSEKAYSAGCSIAEVFRQEFGLDYPVQKSRFQVSSQSDFILHLGIRGTLLIDPDVLARFMPRKKANARFLERSLAQAADDIDSNINNMLYNYRYKMQESLRGMCRELGEQVDALLTDMNALTEHIRANLEAAGKQQAAETQRLQHILDLLQQ